jgi:hypothetical protein
MNYYSSPRDGSAPFEYVDAPPAGQPDRNFEEEEFSVTIQDARGREDDFSLDNDSFKFLRNVPITKVKTFTEDAIIKQNYYPEVEQILFENVPHCKKVFIFDHTVRSLNKGTKRPPLTRCHLDQTPASAMERVKYHLPDEAEELLQSRYRIINVWMPVNGPVVEFPLGIVSVSSASEKDFVGIKHIYPHRIGESGGVKYNSKHQWYYWSGIDGSERILLQCFDSDALIVGSGVIGGRAPHSAFEDPRTPNDVPHRISIEVRALVFC